ncbi:molecular chaperone DnaJ [Alteromonas sp.]|nr:molecular chaperone DnaJ [Alteromonas sp.]
MIEFSDTERTSVSDAHLTLLIDTLATLRPVFERGINEYSLINTLKAPPFALFKDAELSDPLILFNTHFLLFHCLYKLREQWRLQGIGELDIHATNIVLRAIDTNVQPQHSETHAKNIGAIDALAEYYLNLHNMTSTSLEDVETLIDDFWQRMAGNPVKVSTEDIKHACELLDIDTATTLTLVAIKKHYKKKLQFVHPDKGGSTLDTQEVIAAYKLLLRHINVL